METTPGAAGFIASEPSRPALRRHRDVGRARSLRAATRDQRRVADDALDLVEGDAPEALIAAGQRARRRGASTRRSAAGDGAVDGRSVRDLQLAPGASRPPSRARRGMPVSTVDLDLEMVRRVARAREAVLPHRRGERPDRPATRTCRSSTGTSATPRSARTTEPSSRWKAELLQRRCPAGRPRGRAPCGRTARRPGSES